jgi:uncharacterized protein involved in high-affinity Fe2+ transport
VKHFLVMIVFAAVAGSVCSAAQFREYPIGDEITTNAMTVAPVYLPPIKMDMPGHEAHDMEQFSEPGKEKLHLEADIHAAKGNKNGFAAGEWMPYLNVRYKLTNVDTGKTTEGVFMPMVARDGPHYGATARMLGKGKYKLTYFIEPPVASSFGRHTDEITGVAPWWKPFELQWQFDYNGLPAQ